MLQQRPLVRLLMMRPKMRACKHRGPEIRKSEHRQCRLPACEQEAWRRARDWPAARPGAVRLGKVEPTRTRLLVEDRISGSRGRNKSWSI